MRNSCFADIRDYGAAFNGAKDDTAAFEKAAEDVFVSFGGGTIELPHGFSVVNEFALNYPNVIFQGQSAGYGYNGPAAGTTLRPTTGRFCAMLQYTAARSALGSGFRGVQFESTGNDSSNAEYGLVISSSCTVIENVSVIGFKRNVECMNLDANKFRYFASLWATRSGWAVTSPAEKAYVHPNILDLLEDVNGDYVSTVYSMRDFLIRRNYVGAIIRDGDFASFEEGVIEGNKHHGLILFCSQGSPTVNGPYNGKFSGIHCEGNFDGFTGADSSKYSLSGVLSCKTSSTEYLKGNSSGQWASTAYGATTDAGYDVWIGSVKESDPKVGGANPYYNASGFSSVNVFDRCSFSSPGSVKIRSGWRNELRDCAYYYGGPQGGGNWADTVNLGPYAYDTKINGGSSRVSNLAQVGGTRTQVDL